MGASVLVPFHRYKDPKPKKTCERCVYLFVCGDMNKTDNCKGRIVVTNTNRHIPIDILGRSRDDR